MLGLKPTTSTPEHLDLLQLVFSYQIKVFVSIQRPNDHNAAGCSLALLKWYHHGTQTFRDHI